MVMLARPPLVVARIELTEAIDGLGDWQLISTAHTSEPGGMFAVSAEIQFPGGHWRVCDRVSPSGTWLRLERRWTLLEAEAAHEADLALSIACPSAKDTRALLPGILYDGNRWLANERLTPRIPNSLPATVRYEEHRFPLPLVHLEFTGEDGLPVAVSLQSEPERRPPDAWWSIGCRVDRQGAWLLAHSRLCETNGQTETVYGSQNRLHDFRQQPIRVEPGETIAKVFFLVAHADVEAGWSWRRPAAEARARILKPPASYLTPEGAIRAKLHAVRRRFHQRGGVAGFLYTTQPNQYNRPDCFEWGWTGQSNRLCRTLLDISASSLIDEPPGQPRAEEMAHAALRFYAAQPAPGPLPWLRYQLDGGRWQASDRRGNYHSRQVGEALTNLAACCRHPLSREADWRRSAMRILEAAAGFLVTPDAQHEGLLPTRWQPDGIPVPAPPTAAGVTCVSALIGIDDLLPSIDCRPFALELLAHYCERFLGSDAAWPSGATLDAHCIDKEGGIFLLRACVDAYAATRDDSWLEWARRAADWTLTFMYAWDPGFRPGSRLDNKMSCTGWNSVSVQNHHIDVFTPVRELLRLAEFAKDEECARIAKIMCRAVTQTIAIEGDWRGFEHLANERPIGEQAEQFFQTNYYQGDFDESDWRGGLNWWNPLWTIVHPLDDIVAMLEYENDHGPVHV